jgi:hypothetical protein
MKIHHMLEMPKADPIAAALAQTQKEGAEEEEEDEARAGGHEGSASEEEFEHADGQDPLGEEDQEESEEEAAEEDEREDENAAAARVEMCRQAAQALVGATRRSTGMTPPDARADARADMAAATPTGVAAAAAATPTGVAAAAAATPTGVAPAAAATAANSVTHKKEYMAFVRLAKNAKRMPTSLQGEFSRDKIELFNLWLTAEKDVGKLQLLVKRKARAKGFNQPSCTVCSLELSLFVHVSLSC